MSDHSLPRIPREEDRYRLLVDAITDYAIYMLDPQGRVTSWNAGAQRFKGYKPDEIIGEHFSRFYTDEDRERGLPAEALEIARVEGRFESENWRVRKDGERFWAHVIIDPIWTPVGELMGYAKITRDLSERKLAQEALRQSEEQFTRLVQGVTDYAIYMLDREGKVSNWNAGAQRIKGYTPEEIIGRHFSTFYGEEDRISGVPDRGLMAALIEGRWESEGWRIRKDGSRFWAHVIIDAIKGDDGEVIGFAKITRDITERMEAQRQLEEAREALFQSQKLEAIGQLTGGVAHDFNNLLMAVLGSLELMRKRVGDDPRITPLLENAIQGAERGASLTKRMLAFARKQELQLSAVDLPDLVRGMEGFMARSIGPTVVIETDFAPDLPLAWSDPSQLEAALLNLAVNARDAMPQGGTITIVARPEGEARVRLTVCDTGEGMDADTLERAAEPFFTTKGVGKGTGLGLSMVHGLAAQSGGELKIESTPGEGTKVHLLLPIAEAGAEPVRQPTATAEPGRVERLTVLAVDDDPLVLHNTAALLEDLGHEVLTARSGKAALQLFKREPGIDLVITDQVMPSMTGIQLAEALRRERPEAAILLVTGYAEMPDGVAPDLPRLTKPFTQRELSRAVQEIAASPVAA